MTRLASFVAGKTFGQVIERAQISESLGYESNWIIQVADREATIVAAAIASATSQIGIGTGVLPIYPRTPAVMAQTAATLDDLSNGRFILGLGTSHQLTIETWHGMTLDRPLAHMRQYVSAVRAIFSGETYFGDIYKTAFSFMGYEPPRRDLPIYVSCLSPRMCHLAGELADGAVLWMCSPLYIEKVVVPAIAEGRERAGKTMDDFEIVAAVPLALTEDRAAARDAFRKVAIVYWSLPFYRAAVAGAGLDEALRSFDEQGPAGIPDDAVDQFIGAGDDAACREALDRYRSAGVTLPAVSSLPSHEGSASYEDLLKAVAPQ